ncbi:radical SAM/SPASM domain-containing protein [Clostridium gasigenes]|uniref:Radical SAM protein n=1 Tax=Clostridium gasigenes TaxID=94869 RepID=A0A7X0S8R4_9CLOT|nr:radical SAM protein [Clostridium gasigenes]MBB6713128.1 radical SAM protein [Clostridium gasigenes]
MNISFWVTKQCNLNCNYCYVSKKNKKMTLDTAKSAVEFAIDKINTSKDEKIKISIHGGEPFLNLEVGRYIVENIKSLVKNGKELLFTLTTNGTLINDEIISFIKDNINYSFSISIDGLKDIHDMNRKYINGEGSFDDVIKNLNKLKENNIYPRIRTTITPETVNKLYETFIYFQKLGYSSISSILDFTDDRWNEENLNVYYENLSMIMAYLKENDFNNFKSKLNNMKKATFSKKGECGAGKSSLHIDYNGDIYPCSYSLDNKNNAIGSIYNGIEIKKIENIKLINESEIEKCAKCKYKSFCDGNRCKYVNLKINGYINKPSNLHCYINYINHKILLDNLEYL